MCFLNLIFFITVLSVLEAMAKHIPTPYLSMDQLSSTSATDGCDKPLILTPYIKSGKIKEAQKLARVHLQQIEDIESYSGFLTVNESCDSNMFFWYFPTERKQANDPLVIWLQGEIGMSSLFGLTVEIGPFNIENGTKLEKRQYHWSDKRNLLFIDNPVGSGFSFTKIDSECYSHNQDEVRTNLYEALLQFYKLFPDLQKNDLYIFGEYYAGKYVPALAYSIHENNKNAKIKINLKGLGIGDGYTDPVSMLDYSSLFYNVGLFNSIDSYYLEGVQDQYRDLILQKDWWNATGEFERLKYGISMHLPNLFNYIKTRHRNFDAMFFHRRDIKCALHAGNIYFDSKGYYVRKFLLEDIGKSVKPWVEELLEHYRIMFYNGQVGVMVGPAMTQNFLKTLKWSGAAKFNEQDQFGVRDGGLIGFGTEYGNLCEYRIRNAGNMAPHDQPKATYYIMDNFINKKSSYKEI